MYVAHYMLPNLAASCHPALLCADLLEVSIYTCKVASIACTGGTPVLSLISLLALFT